MEQLFLQGWFWSWSTNECWACFNTTSVPFALFLQHGPASKRQYWTCGWSFMLQTVQPGLCWHVPSPTISETSVILYQSLARPSWTTGVLQGPPQNLEVLWTNQVPHDHQQGGIFLFSSIWTKLTFECRQKPHHWGHSCTITKTGIRESGSTPHCLSRIQCRTPRLCHLLLPQASHTG